MEPNNPRPNLKEVDRRWSVNYQWINLRLDVWKNFYKKIFASLLPNICTYEKLAEHTLIRLDSGWDLSMLTKHWHQEGHWNIAPNIDNLTITYFIDITSNGASWKRK